MTSGGSSPAVLNYTVTVASAGTYDLEFRVASAGAGGTFHLEVNGVTKTGGLQFQTRAAGRHGPPFGRHP